MPTHMKNEFSWSFVRSLFIMLILIFGSEFEKISLACHILYRYCPKKTWNFKNICLYETGKVAVSARVISSDVRWRRIAKGMTQDATHERFQWIRVLSSIQLSLDDRVVVAGFTWCVIIWLPFITRSNMQTAFQLNHQQRSCGNESTPGLYVLFLFLGHYKHL